MKATNHPSDKMTIKNNNGDLLLEIDAEGVKSIKFKDGNEITGKDISDAVAKADTVPAVTSADASKALVVDDDGKIVAGEAGGGLDMKILDIVNSSVAGLAMIAFLASATTEYTSLTTTNLTSKFLSDINALFESLNGAETLAFKLTNSTQGNEMSMPPVFASVIYTDTVKVLYTHMGVTSLNNDFIMWNISITIANDGASGSITVGCQKATPRAIN